MIGLIVKTDGSIEEFTYTGYPSLRDAVGGLIECVASARCPETDLQYDLWGNEESRIRSRTDSNFKNNFVAQKITAHMTETPITGLLSLHGTHVVLGVSDEGDSIGLSDYLLDTLKTLAVSPEEAKKHEDEYSEPFTQFRGFY